VYKTTIAALDLERENIEIQTDEVQIWKKKVVVKYNHGQYIGHCILVRELNKDAPLTRPIINTNVLEILGPTWVNDYNCMITDLDQEDSVV